MTRKQAIITIIAVIALLAVIFIWLYMNLWSTGSTPYTPTNTSSQQGTHTGNQGNNTNQNQNQGNQNQGQQPNQNQGNSVAFRLPVLREIWAQPVAGYVTFNKNATSSATSIRFVERATGHVYETSNTSSETDRISDTRIPKIYQAIWNNTGTAFYARYLDGNTLQTYYATLGRSTSAASSTNGVLFAPLALSGSFLQSNIGNVMISPDTKNSLFYTIVQVANKAITDQSVVAKPDGSNPFLLTTSPLIEWATQWPNKNLITYTNKPSASFDGHLFFLNVTTGLFTEIADGLGLTTNTNSDGSLVLETTATDGGIATNLYTVKTSTTSPFPLSTMAEKCTWSKKTTTAIYCAVPSNIPNASYPDDWYQGTVSFADDLWKIDTKTGSTKLLLSLSPVAHTNIDATELSLSPDEHFLYFINKNDGSFWSLDMSQSTVN
jgi:hypothetical protein